jgi:hypothetical protein
MCTIVRSSSRLTAFFYFVFYKRTVVEQEYLASSQLETGKVEAYVELHIEQGPLLENGGQEVGIVTGIFGPALVHVQSDGSGGHGSVKPLLAGKTFLRPHELQFAIFLVVCHSIASQQTVGEDLYPVYPTQFLDIPRLLGVNPGLLQRVSWVGFSVLVLGGFEPQWWSIAV